MLFALSTITYSVGDRLDYVFFYISSLSFIVSNYLVLLRPLSNNSILLSTSTIIVSVIVYFLGGEIGGYIYDDLEVNRVFDKYVSINAPLVFIVLAITLVYTVVWS